MLTIKMNNTENRSLLGAAGADNTLMRVFRGMARTAYGYALKVPDAIHFYIRMDPSDTTSAVIFPIFKIGETYFEMSNLHTAEAIDPKTKEPADFNFDQERQLSLHKYLGTDLLNDGIPFLTRRMKQVPDEFFVSYDVEGNEIVTELAYRAGRFNSPVENSSALRNSDETKTNVEEKIGEGQEQELSSAVQKTVAQWIEELKNPELKTVINVADYPDLLGEDFMLDL